MLKQFITSKQDRSGLQSSAGEAVAVGRGTCQRLSASRELCVDQILGLDHTRCAGFIPVCWSPLTNRSVDLCSIQLDCPHSEKVFLRSAQNFLCSHLCLILSLGTSEERHAPHAPAPSHPGCLHELIPVCP